MNRSIRRMAEEISRILEGRVHSVWLYGSTVLDDFRPGWSDIDLLSLSEGPISPAQPDGRLYSCGWLLDIARCIYTLRFEDVVSKTRAGTWALEEHLFDDEAPLQRTLTIRREPLSYGDRDDVKQWLKGLGPTVQAYADVLERELLRQTETG